MRIELDELLCKKYPEIFRDRNAPMSQTCMCWGFDCGDGWFNIIDALCAQIMNHVKNHNRSAENNRNYHTRRNAALAGDLTLFNEHFDKIYTPTNLATNKEALEKHRQEALEELLNQETSKWLELTEDMEVPVAAQVKEKFGTLRFYYAGGDQYIYGLEAMAEDMSARTCEVCGNVGKIREGGWIRTLCDEHAKEGNYDLNIDEE